MTEKLAMEHINDYLMTALQRRLKNCEACSTEVVCTTITDNLGRVVKKPSPQMNIFLLECFWLGNDLLPRHDVYLRQNVGRNLCQLLANRVNVTFACHAHDTKTIIIKRFLHFFIHTWCNNVNSLLKGSDLSWKINFTDPVKNAAQKRSEKYRIRNASVAKTKKLKV